MSDDRWVLGMEVDAEAVDAETGATLNIAISVKDVPAIKLLIWELTELHDEMRVGASPFADRLEGALRRFGVESDE